MRSTKAAAIQKTWPTSFVATRANTRGVRRSLEQASANAVLGVNGGHGQTGRLDQDHACRCGSITFRPDWRAGSEGFWFPAPRGRPRNSARDCNGLLGHIGWAGQRIECSKDRDWLRRGLAAASIEDNLTDYRDTLVALGRIYLAAARAGLDVSDSFQEAGQLSSSDPNPRLNQSMRDFRSEFEQSAYFEHAIQSEFAAKS